MITVLQIGMMIVVYVMGMVFNKYAAVAIKVNLVFRMGNATVMVILTTVPVSAAEHPHWNPSAKIPMAMAWVIRAVKQYNV